KDGLIIKPETLPSAVWGSAYSQTLNTEGGDGNYTYSLTTGALPDGVTLNASGNLSGTPSQTGNFNFQVSVIDGQSNTGERSFVLQVSALSSMVISPSSLADGTFGTNYSEFFTATGGNGANRFSVDSGALPIGLTLGSDGSFGGVPAETGEFSFDIRVTDTVNNTGVQSYVLKILPDPDLFELTPSVLPAGTYGAPYNVTIDTTGGVAPFTGKLTGTLPSGITFDTSSGKLSGTPLETGDYPISVVVTDSFGNQGSRDYVLSIQQRSDLSITPPSLPNGDFGDEYSQLLSASNGDGNYVFSVSDGTLPSGLSLSSAGNLSGILSQTGTYQFTVAVEDGQ
ncbi:MAG: Ig domain-containing protein, partial [Roseibium sp.]